MIDEAFDWCVKACAAGEFVEGEADAFDLMEQFSRRFDSDFPIQEILHGQGTGKFPASAMMQRFPPSYQAQNHSEENEKQENRTKNYARTKESDLKLKTRYRNEKLRSAAVRTG